MASAPSGSCNIRVTRSLGHYRLIHYTKIFWASSLLVFLTVPSIFAPFVVLLVLWATAVALGPLALLSVVAFLIASCALGSMLLRTSGDPSPERQLCATLLGIGVYIFLMTFLARLPLNYPAVYVVLLAAPVLVDIRGVWRRLRSWTKALVLSRPRKRPQVAAFALLVFVLGMHWMIVPQPESSADGLAMHLAVPADIAPPPYLDLPAGTHSLVRDAHGRRLVLHPGLPVRRRVRRALAELRHAADWWRRCSIARCAAL